MGNTANFEGATLYAPQSAPTICGDPPPFFLNKTKTRPFPAILTTQPRAGACVGDEER